MATWNPNGSRRQIFGLGYTNHMRGLCVRASLQNETKPEISPDGTRINVRMDEEKVDKLTLGGRRIPNRGTCQVMDS